MNETKAAVKAQRQFEGYVAGVFADSKNHFDERQARKTRRQSDWVSIKGSQLCLLFAAVAVWSGVIAVVVSVIAVKFLLGR